MARRNLDNAMSELIIACGVAAIVAISLCIVVHQQRDIWAAERARVSDTEAVQRVLIPETPILSPGLERVQ